MAIVIALLKVTPSGPDVDIEKLQEKIKEIREFEVAEVVPLAFGMKNLMLTYNIDDKVEGIDPIVEKINNLDEVSSCEIESMGRAREV